MLMLPVRLNLEQEFQKMNTRFCIAIVLILSLTATGCMFHGGEQKYVNPPTLGQELADLKIALNNGAIDEGEYHLMKKQLINSDRWQDSGHHEKD